MLHLLLSLLIAASLADAAYSQEPKTEAKAQETRPPYERLLTGDDAKKAEELQQQIDKLSKADDYAGAIRSVEELLSLRIKVQGADHYKVVNAKQNLEALSKVAALEVEKREGWRLAMKSESRAAELEAKVRYAAAFPIRQKILDRRREVLGEEHLYTATSYNNLAANLGAQGKAFEAAPLFQKALDIWRKILGEEHPDTATGYGNLAFNLSARGKAAEAAPLLQKALAIRRKVLGEEHSHTAQSYNSLAANLDDQGKAAEAAPLYQKALDIQCKVLGEEHPDTVTSFNNLAFNLSARGKAAEAAPLLQKALAIRRKVLGEEHPDTAQSYNNLAFNLSARGKAVEAAPLLQKALEIFRKVLGEEHPHTAQSYNNLAGNLDVQGKAAEAAPLHQKAFAIRRKVLGEEHPDTASSYNNIASNLDYQGKAAEAAPLYQKALDIRRKALGEEHPDTASSYNNLASNLDDQGKNAEAAPLYQKALDIRRRVLGEEHPDTALSYNNFAFNLIAQKKAADAETVLRRALFVYEASRLTGAKGIDRALLTTFNPRLLLSVLEQSRAPTQAWSDLETTLARAMLDEQPQGKDTLPPEQEAELKRLRGRIAAVQQQILILATKQARSADETSLLENLLSERRTAQESLAKIAVAASTREVASSDAIRAALPQDAAILLWADVSDKSGNVQEHWACVVRLEGLPKWERLSGTGDDAKWSNDDTKLPAKLRAALRSSTASPIEIKSLSARLRAQRIAPVEKHLVGVKTLYVVPVNYMAGLPVELIAPEFQIEYVTSGTALARAATKPKFSGKSSLLAIGDPVFPPADPQKVPPLPPGGILVVNVVAGGAAENKVQDGDVLVSYGGVELKDFETLGKTIAAKAQEKSVPVQIWRVTEEGKPVTKTIDLAPGRLGANLAKEPARELLAKRHESEMLLASASRSGRIDEKTGEKEPWIELPGTAVELDRLQKEFGDQATIFARSQASEQKLEELKKANKLKDYRYLHFATHGLANNDKAFESFLVLAQDKLPTFNATAGEKYYNGELSAREVMDEWKLDADLVTLSACESALGKAGGGDGLLGFTQAFLLAGARNVCLSLWEVDDTATSLLMDRFYQNLLGKREGLTEPMKKAAALREAKNWLKNLTAEEVLKLSADMTKSVTRGKDEKLPPVLEAKTVAPQGDLKAKPYADPRFWSAFILVGNPD